MMLHLLCHMSFGVNIKLLCSSALSKCQMWDLICAWPPPSGPWQDVKLVTSMGPKNLKKDETILS